MELRPLLPNRGATSTEIPVCTIALDGPVDLVALVLPWPETSRTAYARAYALPGDRFAHVFQFGACVVEGAARVPDDVAAALVAATGRSLWRDTEETYRVVVDAGHRPMVRWDRVVVDERSPSTLGAVALLLGQSAALERYERQANALVDEAMGLARYVERRGRLPFGLAVLTRRVARITEARLELARRFFLVDRPESAWEDERVDRLYDALFDNLELRQRRSALLHKLEAVETTTETLVDLWHTRQSYRLEVAIVALIVLELALAVFR